MSPADREFLLGEKEDLTEQSKRDARYRIRNRLENAVYDVHLLSAHLEDRDREQVFENALEDRPHGVLVGSLFELPIRGMLDVVEHLEHAIKHIEETLEGSIYNSLLEIDDEYLIEVDVSINVDREKPDIEELLNKYEEGEETRAELRYLQRHDELEFDLDTAVRSLQHMHEDELLEGGEIRLIPESDKEPVPVPYEEDTDFESFIEDFKEVWNEVMERKQSEGDSAS